MNIPGIPSDFRDHLTIANASRRFDEVARVRERIMSVGVGLKPNLDHAAIFTDPPHLVAGPIKGLGYVSGWDSRCYPSPVDGRDYINVSARLPAECPAREKGWSDYIAVVHPVDLEARTHMLSREYGNPFIHHLTLGIVPPDRKGQGDLEYAGTLIVFMARARKQIREVLDEKPGTLIVALPRPVIDHSDFPRRCRDWLGELDDGERQVETMDGGGFLLQFFVLEGGRVEVALRVGTSQTFNPKSVVKISRDEISAVQD